jgi:hypothetical protein
VDLQPDVLIGKISKVEIHATFLALEAPQIHVFCEQQECGDLSIENRLFSFGPSEKLVKSNSSLKFRVAHASGYESHTSNQR